MKKLLKSATVVAGVALAGAAFAGGPDHMAPPPQTAWYAGAHIGPTFTSSTDRVNTGSNIANLNTGFDVGGQLGYRWNPHMRAELAYSYFRHGTTAVGRTAAVFNATSISFHTLMANVYYDANPIVYHLYPFFGVGLGWWNQYTGSTGPLVGAGGSRNAFAYQGIAGVGYHVMENMSVYAEYRIVSWTNLAGFWNAFNVGMNYFFNF